jgi:hypothetical protein
MMRRIDRITGLAGLGWENIRIRKIIHQDLMPLDKIM